MFGADLRAPWARVDHAGLLWLLQGNKLVVLSEDRAVIETQTGSRLTYYRRENMTDGVVVAWDLR